MEVNASLVLAAATIVNVHKGFKEKTATKVKEIQPSNIIFQSWFTTCFSILPQ